MLGEGILMLVLYINSGPGRLLRSNYSIISGPTGQNARGGDPNASSLPIYLALKWIGYYEEEGI